MWEKVIAFLKERMTKRFIITQFADFIIAIIIFLGVSGKVRIQYCLWAVGIYALISLVIRVCKIIGKVRRGE